MKMIIAYDGSPPSEAAIDDLARAGLPATGEARIVSVAEVWLPPPDSEADDNDSLPNPSVEKLIAKQRQKGEMALAEAREFAENAQKRVDSALHGWKVEARATYGSPAWEILREASEFQPHLIVVGSHGYSPVNRFLLGSISQKILTQAHCSVRVARGRVEVDGSPIRVMVGFDATKGAEAAARAVARRSWPAGTEVRLVVVTEPMEPKGVGRFVPAIDRLTEEVNEAEHEWITEHAAASLEALQKSGVTAELKVIVGSPKNTLTQYAEEWGADSIFVGANAFGSRIERFLIGSTSAAVAARAHCTVEVVRE